MKSEVQGVCVVGWVLSSKPLVGGRKVRTRRPHGDEPPGKHRPNLEECKSVATDYLLSTPLPAGKDRTRGVQVGWLQITCLSWIIALGACLRLPYFIHPVAFPAPCLDKEHPSTYPSDAVASAGVLLSKLSSPHSDHIPLFQRQAPLQELT